jgi:hypothetical protein
MLYETSEGAFLPQDMYILPTMKKMLILIFRFRQLSRPLVFQGLLRIRTSEQFKPSHSFGHLLPGNYFSKIYWK